MLFDSIKRVDYLLLLADQRLLVLLTTLDKFYLFEVGLFTVSTNSICYLCFIVCAFTQTIDNGAVLSLDLLCLHYLICSKLQVDSISLTYFAWNCNLGNKYIQGPGQSTISWLSFNNRFWVFENHRTIFLWRSTMFDNARRCSYGVPRLFL